jgi:hypothetical protein
VRPVVGMRPDTKDEESERGRSTDAGKIRRILDNLE